jgi:hypothetical protein
MERIEIEQGGRLTFEQGRVLFMKEDGKEIESSLDSWTII